MGSHTVPMVANAATVIRYRQIFGRDLLLLVNNEGESDYTGELAYVMAMQAAKADMSKLSFETYIKWAEEFDVLDLFSQDVSNEIMAIFISQQKTVAKEKKKADAPNEK